MLYRSLFILLFVSGCAKYKSSSDSASATPEKENRRFQPNSFQAFLYHYPTLEDLQKKETQRVSLKETSFISNPLKVNFVDLKNEGAGFIDFRMATSTPSDLRCRVRARGNLNYSRQFLKLKKEGNRLFFPINLSTLGPYSIHANQDTFFTLQCKIGDETALRFDFQIALRTPKTANRYR